MAQDGPTDAVGAYKEIAHNWKYNDFQNACPAMSAGYQHKLLAELELFSGDCRALVAEISKQLNGRDAIKDLSVTAVKGPTVAGSVLVRSKVSGGIVRDRYDFVRLNGQWVIAGDRNFDATGPHGPVKAYEKAEGLQVTGLAAYRILQEALTNALRHGDPTKTVGIDLLWDSQALHLRVRNAVRPAAPAPAGTTPASSAGHGIPGMRERAALAGGSLTAGLVNDAGAIYEVSAVFPISAVAPKGEQAR